MKYKLITIDLDDTLLRDDHSISQKTKEVIKICQERGIFVTFSTGRMFRAALPYALDLNIKLPLITYQGALLKDVEGREYFHQTIALDLSKKILEFLIKEDIHTNIYLDDKLYMLKDNHWGRTYSEIIKVDFEVLEEPLQIQTEPTKIIIIDAEEKIKKYHQELESRFGQEVYLTQSKPIFLEISHPKASKAQGVEKLAKKLSIKREEILAFGDGLNDLDMIEYAGCGVAVKNAHPSLKKAADFVAPWTNNEDAVARTIEKLLLDS